MPGRPCAHGIVQHRTCQTATTSITAMDTLLVLISLSFHFAYAASHDQRRRFVKRQHVSSSSSSSSLSEPTQTPISTITYQSSEHSLPASIQSRIPIYPPPPPSGVVQTALPEHPDPNSDKSAIIGFSIGIVALVFLIVVTGLLLFRRYKQREQQQAVSQGAVQLQPTSHYASSITKNSIDDTQSAASHK